MHAAAAQRILRAVFLLWRAPEQFRRASQVAGRNSPPRKLPYAPPWDRPHSSPCTTAKTTALLLLGLPHQKMASEKLRTDNRSWPCVSACRDRGFFELKSLASSAAADDQLPTCCRPAARGRTRDPYADLQPNE